MKDEKPMEVRNLKYVYTKEEALELGKELAYANRQLAELRDQKKSLASQLNSQISAQEEMTNILTTKVGNGYQYKDVECEVFYHSPERGMKRVVRTDIDDSRIEMDKVITEKMNEKDWLLWNDHYIHAECDVEMHTPDVDKKTYTQRTTGLKFIEIMTDEEKAEYETICEVKLQFPREGWKTLVNKETGISIECKMTQEDIDKTQLRLFANEGQEKEMVREEVVVDDDDMNFD